MNLDNDYDSDGNNIVPCPICLNAYCPSKEGGKCPEEDEFMKSQSPQTTFAEKKVEEWEKNFDGLAAGGFFNNRYTGGANYSRTKIFIRDLLATERTAARKDERAVFENMMQFVKDLPHRCPQCGKASESGMTYGKMYAVNALWGRCPKCAMGNGATTTKVALNNPQEV